MSTPSVEVEAPTPGPVAANGHRLGRHYAGPIAAIDSSTGQFGPHRLIGRAIVTVIAALMLVGCASIESGLTGVTTTTGSSATDDDAGSTNDESTVGEPGSGDSTDTTVGSESGDPGGDGSTGTTTDDSEPGATRGDDERGKVGDVPAMLDDAEFDNDISELDGQLAIVDGRTVNVARPDGGAFRRLDGDGATVAAQPVWSPDGQRLVWTSATALSQLARVQTFDGEGAPQAEPDDSPAEGPPIFYYQWSDDGNALVYLRNAPGGGGVEAGAFLPGRPAVPTDTGSPYFLSWSPDGERVAANVDNRSIRILDRIRPRPGAAGAEDAGVPALQLQVDDSGFTAPAWLDEQSVLLVLGGRLTVLVLDDNSEEEERITVVDVATPVRFVVSPDRTKIAYQSPERAGPAINEAGLKAGAESRSAWIAGAESRSAWIAGADARSAWIAGAESRSGMVPGRSRTVQAPAGSALIVLDLVSGQRQPVTPEAALAWEWSPDSTKLAWLSAEGAGGEARWRFWSTTGKPVEGDVTSPTFSVSLNEATNYLPFFAQYTQSVTRWSPDSSTFAVAGALETVAGPVRSGIWLVPVDRPGRPVRVADGDFVTWGSGPAPPVASISPA